ncbi:MAG TPA: antibiotic biosynthesis monooxygenase family protein [Nitrolancea sp.]|nr:antibiotic biosynthesis monooxygenase family protein [Nitrolancea sp.]
MTNTIRVPAAHAEQVEAGFSGSAARMRQVPGCTGFMFLKEEGTSDPCVYTALTQWEDEQSFTNWLASDQFRQAHSGANDRASGGEVKRFSVIVASA